MSISRVYPNNTCPEFPQRAMDTPLDYIQVDTDPTTKGAMFELNDLFNGPDPQDFTGRTIKMDKLFVRGFAQFAQTNLDVQVSVKLRIFVALDRTPKSSIVFSDVFQNTEDFGIVNTIFAYQNLANMNNYEVLYDKVICNITPPLKRDLSLAQATYQNIPFSFEIDLGGIQTVFKDAIPTGHIASNKLYFGAKATIQNPNTHVTLLESYARLIYRDVTPPKNQQWRMEK